MDMLHGMTYIGYLGFLAAICYLIWKQRQNKAYGKQQENNLNEAVKYYEIRKAYQKKWLFSYNEKDAYKKLKNIIEQRGYTVFAKVRLFDLVEPIKDNPKYKTFLYKIQAKHVDFVLADEKLVARYIIELDDSSHNEAKGAERDQFVDTVLESTGYKVLHTKSIEEQQILNLISK